MNRSLKGKGINRIKEKISYFIRVFGKRKVYLAFDENNAKAISRVYIINLDRKPDRWKIL